MAAFPYFPHTEEDIAAMLEKAGVKKLDDLYSDVPAQFLHKGAYALPPAKSEQEIRAWFEILDGMNARLKVFAGAGAFVFAFGGIEGVAVAECNVQAVSVIEVYLSGEK